MKLLLVAAALSLAGCATPSTSTRVSQLESRVRALEANQDLQLARTEVLIRAAMAGPEFVKADDVVRSLEMLEKGFGEQQP